ncbi:hypothetical protein ABK040_012889 [Willaertia magna]
MVLNVGGNNTFGKQRNKTNSEQEVKNEDVITESQLVETTATSIDTTNYDNPSTSTSTTNFYASYLRIKQQYIPNSMYSQYQQTEQTEIDTSTYKLFVGQIPYSYNEEELHPIFIRFGEIAEIAVIRDRFTSKSRGCAFVSFRNKESAETCIKELNQKQILPPLTTPLRVKFAYTEQVINNDLNNGNSSSDDGNNSGETIINPENYDFGEPHPENKLFVRNLPKSVSEEELKTIFETFGEIQDVIVLRTSIHTSKGCGFVKFSTKEAAQKAVETFNDEVINPLKSGGKITKSVFLLDGSVVPILIRYADQKDRNNLFEGNNGRGYYLNNHNNGNNNRNHSRGRKSKQQHHSKRRYHEAPPNTFISTTNATGSGSIDVTSVGYNNGSGVEVKGNANPYLYNYEGYNPYNFPQPFYSRKDNMYYYPALYTYPSNLVEGQTTGDSNGGLTTSQSSSDSNNNSTVQMYYYYPYYSPFPPQEKNRKGRRKQKFYNYYSNNGSTYYNNNNQQYNPNNNNNTEGET